MIPSLNETWLQTLAIYDQDRDTLVDEQDLTSRIEFIRENNQQTIDQKDMTNESQSRPGN